MAFRNHFQQSQPHVESNLKENLAESLSALLTQFAKLEVVFADKKHQDLDSFREYLLQCW